MPRKSKRRELLFVSLQLTNCPYWCVYAGNASTKLLLTVPVHSMKPNQLQGMFARWSVVLPCNEDGFTGPTADLMFAMSKKFKNTSLEAARRAVEGMNASVRKCFAEVLYLESDLPDDKDDYGHGDLRPFMSFRCTRHCTHVTFNTCYSEQTKRHSSPK